MEYEKITENTIDHLGYGDAILAHFRRVRKIAKNDY
jgi:hypothetical protein